jgi:hypothetical protein
VSSSTSTPLELELRPAWWLLSVLAGWVLAIGVQLWDVDRPAWTIVAETLLLVELSAVRGATPGMTASSVKRLAWMPDGSWRLCDGYGWQWSARLAAGSRKWGPVAILVWNDGTRRSWAILTPAAVGPTQYRRFSVRWHLRRHA